jgi:hypothetical protein
VQVLVSEQANYWRTWELLDIRSVPHKDVTLYALLDCSVLNERPLLPWISITGKLKGIILRNLACFRCGDDITCDVMSLGPSLLVFRSQIVGSTLNVTRQREGRFSYCSGDVPKIFLGQGPMFCDSMMT